MFLRILCLLPLLLLEGCGPFGAGLNSSGLPGGFGAGLGGIPTGVGGGGFLGTNTPFSPPAVPGTGGSPFGPLSGIGAGTGNGSSPLPPPGQTLGQTGSLAGGGSSQPPYVGGAGSSDLTSPPALGPDDYDYRPNLITVAVPQVGWSGNSIPYVQDVMGHARNPWQTADSEETTWVHETCHGIHSDTANAQPGTESMYIENGVGVLIAKVGLGKDQLTRYVPQTVQSSVSRFQTYVTDATTGSPMDPSTGRILEMADATYMFDEWGAYINGGRAGVELYQAGRWRSGGQDVVDGMMDFLYISAGVTMLAADQNPGYLDPQSRTGASYKAAFALQAERTAKWLSLGLQVPEFQRPANMDASSQGFHGAMLYHHFRTSPENAAIRRMLVETYGKGWTKRVLGFEA